MEFLIRDYQDTDRKVLVPLLEALQDHVVALDVMQIKRRLPAYGEAILQRISADIAKDGGAILVAEAGNRIVGYVVGIVYRQQEHELLETMPLKTGRVFELFVREEWRTKGVGKALLSAMEIRFRELHCDVVRIDVLAWNSPAQALYRNMGYEDRSVDLIKKLD